MTTYTLVLVTNLVLEKQHDVGVGNHHQNLYHGYGWLAPLLLLYKNFVGHQSRTSAVSAPALSQHVHCCRTPTVVGPLLPRQLHTVSVHRNCRASTGTSCPQYLVFHCYRIPTFTRTSSVSGLPLPQHIDCRRTSAVPTSIPLLQDLHFLRTSTVKVLHCLSTPTVAGPPLLQDFHCSLSQHLHQRAWCFHVFWAGALVRPITSSDLRKCFSLTI